MKNMIKIKNLNNLYINELFIANHHMYLEKEINYLLDVKNREEKING